MILKEAIAIINHAMQSQLGRQMSDIETVLIEGAWQGKTYTQIADKAGYSVNYLTTDIGPKFWKSLSLALGESVTKKNFKAAIERYQNESFQTVQTSALSDLQPLTSNNIFTDWGEAPDVSQFYGRHEEQAILRQWIEKEQCRLIAVLGMGGIGKTSLAVKVAKDLATSSEVSTRLDNGTETTQISAPPFERLIWRSLRNAPPLSLILEDLILILSDQQNSKADMSQLLSWLRQRRCLIILDNVETILKAGDRAGYYRTGYEEYGTFFNLIGGTSHQSCLLLTSREKPGELAVLEGQDGAVRSLQLSGSVEAARSLIQSKGLVGTSEQQQALCDRYSYNPLALKIVATTIHDVFGGEIGAFLVQDTIIFNSIRRLLDEQFVRLSESEQSIMNWLAINREWTTIVDLEADLIPTIPRSQLIEALESLKWRGLIERQLTHTRLAAYTQQPVVMEYVGDRLIEQLSQELVSAELDWINRYPMFKTTVKDYIGSSQLELILMPIAEIFCEQFPSPTMVRSQILYLLERIRQSPSLQAGYSTGNVINLGVNLPCDLTDFDFSRLTIRHADLCRTPLKGVNFSQAHFVQTRFKQTFGSLFAGSFSQDGQHLLVGDSSGDLRIWSIPDLNPIMTLRGHHSFIWSIALSPDGKHIATSSEDGTVTIWDSTTGQQLNTIAIGNGAVQSIAWSSRNILASGCNDFTVKLWQPLTGACLQTLAGHQDAVNTVSWNRLGDRLASAGNDGCIKIWDGTTGTCIHTLAEQHSPIRSLAWHPVQPLLASSNERGEIKILDGQTGTDERTLQGHTHPIWSIAWDPTGMQLVSSSHDGTVRLWNAQTGECLRIFRGHLNWVWFAVFHPTQPILASGGHDGMLRLWAIQTGRCLKALTGHQSTMRSLAWQPDGAVLAAGCDDTVIRLWTIQANPQFQSLTGHTNAIADLAWSPDGTRLASASHDYTVRIWDSASGHCLHTLQEHTNWIWSITWHPTQPLLASGSVDQTIQLWHADTGMLLQTLPGHTSWVLSVAWHPAGTLLASSSADASIRLWEIGLGECCQVIHGHQHWIQAIAWSPDGMSLASASYDGTARILSGDDFTCLHVLSHPNVVYAVAWSPDQSYLATACYDAIVRLWCPRTGTCLKQLEGHSHQLNDLTVSPDGGYLTSTSEDGTARFWDVASGECIHIWSSDRPYAGMNLTGVTGITDAQRATLEALGAIESSQTLESMTHVSISYSLRSSLS